MGFGETLETAALPLMKKTSDGEVMLSLTLVTEIDPLPAAPNSAPGMVTVIDVELTADGVNGTETPKGGIKLTRASGLKPVPVITTTVSGSLINAWLGVIEVITGEFSAVTLCLN